MKLNNPTMETLGGAGAASRWGPADHGYYERQWRTQRGAWGSPDVPDRLKADVARVVDAFHRHGAKAGLREAHRRGVLDGARIYLANRAATEEELSVHLARVRARLATKPVLADRIIEAFLQARLEEVRRAVGSGQTPPQAVVDRPEIPRREVPRWVIFSGLALSVVAFLRSFR